MKTPRCPLPCRLVLLLSLVLVGAAHRAVMALKDYGRHFEHPQWKPLR